MVRKGGKKRGNSDDSSPRSNEKTARGKGLLEPIPKADCPFDFTSPSALFESLIAPSGVSVKDFFDNYWEKKHLHIASSAAKQESDIPDSNDENSADNGGFAPYFKRLFNFDVLEQIVQSNKIQNNLDLNACHYVDGKRVNAGDVKDLPDVATNKEIRELFASNKMTLQFHQPQRFHKELWKLQEKLECFFGCLVGSNVYMTPENSQGLAPHYDDVEVFILQLEGVKTWKLYSPTTPLARECSGDLSSRDELRLIEHVTLRPGHVLYFPRGTIHEAKVGEGGGHSTHLTISTYQCNTWGDYISAVLPSLTERAVDASPLLRHGLPLNYSHTLGAGETRRKFGEMLKELLEAIARDEKCLEEAPSDPIKCDFFANRLPPFGSTRDPIGSTPSLQGSVRFAYPDHILLSNGKGLYDDVDTVDDSCLDDDDVTDDDDVIDDDVYVYHTAGNDRATHCIGEPAEKPNGLRFSSTLFPALRRLKESGREFIAVQKLGEFPKLIGLDMLVGLWAEGLLECKTC